MFVVVVFFTLTDRASTIPSNTRGCQSGSWSAGQKKIRGTSTKLQREQRKAQTHKRQRERNRNNNKIHRSEKDKRAAFDRESYHSRYVSGRFSVAPFSSNSRKATAERDQKVTLVPLAASNHERESSRRGSHRPTREGYLGSSQP